MAVVDGENGLAVDLFQRQLVAAEFVLVTEVGSRQRQREFAIALGVPQNNVVFVSSCKKR